MNELRFRFDQDITVTFIRDLILILGDNVETIAVDEFSKREKEQIVRALAHFFDHCGWECLSAVRDNALFPIRQAFFICSAIDDKWLTVNNVSPIFWRNVKEMCELISKCIRNGTAGAFSN